MLTHKKAADTSKTLSLSQRREYMKLPLAERRKRLVAQAKRMIAHYEDAAQQSERLSWQGGDIAEP
jgi:hypothetical protein